eukprot:9130208-Lingulodinium_polyedra.AAC.1
MVPALVAGARAHLLPRLRWALVRASRPPCCRVPCLGGVAALRVATAPGHLSTAVAAEPCGAV